MKRHAVRLALLALGILIYQLKLSTLPILGKVYWALSIFLMPAYELKNYLETKAGELLSQYILLHNVQRENAILKRQIAELNTLSAELKVCKQELKTLSEHTGIKAEYSQIGALPARVLGYDPLGYDRFLLIDKGMSAGVERGMLVVVGEELLGVVDQVFAQSSRVKTLYSQGFSISVSVEDRAYIYRGGFPIGSLLFVRSEDELQVGQEVVLRANGLSGLRIGYITSVGPDSGEFFKQVFVKPSVDIRRVKTCVVLRRKL